VEDVGCKEVREFCRRNCENRRSWVCSSVMEVVRDRDRKKLNSEVRVR
jgi:hypothetical protein